MSAQVISANQPAAQGPVSYSSVNQLNLLLSQLEHASQAAQVDSAKLRIEKWKTDSDNKRQAQRPAASPPVNLHPVDPLLTCAGIAAGVAVLAWVLSLVTREYSWVDRIWSIVPVVYVAVFAGAAHGSTTPGST